MASIQKRPDGNYRARYRDEAGKEHARHFKRKVDAQRWLDEVTTAVVTGTYVDPQAGKVTFRRFYSDWSQRQIWVPSTRVNAERVVATVSFSDMPMKSIRRSHVESWIKSMTSTGLAASTIKTRFNVLRAIFRAAVADRVIVTDPSVGVTLPRRRSRDASMTIPTEQQVGAILRAGRPEFQAFIALCAFADLRSGEAAGVQVGDVGLRELRVARQVQRDSREVAVRLRSTGRSGWSTYPRNSWRFLASTSRPSRRRACRPASCSEPRMAGRWIATPCTSAGGTLPRERGSRASGCTISGTSTHRD